MLGSTGEGLSPAWRKVRRHGLGLVYTWREHHLGSKHTMRGSVQGLCLGSREHLGPDGFIQGVASFRLSACSPSQGLLSPLAQNKEHECPYWNEFH